MAKLELEPRQYTPRWFTVGVQLLTVLGALVVASFALLAVNVNPLEAYRMMFIVTLTDQFQFNRLINRSAPLILAGLAVYLPLRSGLYNIGAEGQLILGGFGALWVGVNLAEMLGISETGLPIILLAILASMLLGVIWVIVPVLLYVKYEVNEILTTLMLVFAAERLSTYLIAGPMQASIGAFPRTGRVGFSVPMLFGTGINVGIVLALLAVALTWVLVNRTLLGYEIILSGSNVGVAKQTGIGTAKITFVVFAIAAAFAGLAGFLEVAGNQGTLTIGWPPGYGWTAIPIALLGRRGSLQTMAAGFLFGAIFVGGLAMETSLGVPSAISQIIEALIILFLITAEFLKTYRFDVIIGTRSVKAMVTEAGGFSRLGGN